jgi:tetratricopeptide (TPR) repeat protein
MACICGQNPADDELRHFDRLIAAREFEKAASELERFVAIHPDSAAAQYQLGYVEYRRHRIMQSVKALSKSLSLDSRNADAHRILGFDLTILQRVDLATTEFERAIALQPDFAENHYALGRVAYERGSYELSAAELQKAISIAPDFMKAHQSLGLVYEALNDLRRAREQLELGVTLTERSGRPSEWPYVNFAAFQNRRGEYAKALEYVGRALTIKPRSNAAHYQAAKAYAGLNRWNECIRELRAGIEIDPRNPEFFYMLATAYRRTGDRENAQASMKEYEKLKVWETAAPQANPVMGDPE